jgi:hypothetical protein
MLFVAAVFPEVFVRSKLIVSGDAAATANNIMAAEGLWRLSFAGDLIVTVCYVPITLILYVLLRPVNRNFALLAAFFSLVGCAVGGIAALGHFAPVLLLGGSGYLKAFDLHQLQALAFLALKLYGYGSAISLVFFGFYCLFLGYLIFGANYLPKTLGVLLAIGGLGYLANTFAGFLVPAFPARIFLLPGIVAELALTVWLIVMGVNVPKWQERANRLTG